jgi:hypothetical protein
LPVRSRPPNSPSARLPARSARPAHAPRGCPRAPSTGRTHRAVARAMRRSDAPTVRLPDR